MYYSSDETFDRDLPRSLVSNSSSHQFLFKKNWGDHSVKDNEWNVANDMLNGKLCSLSNGTHFIRDSKKQYYSRD
jgi:hypothetical protein